MSPHAMPKDLRAERQPARRMGLMAEAKPEPQNTTPKSGGTQLLNRLDKVSYIPVRIFCQLLRGWNPPVCARTKDKLRLTSGPWS